jgi:hypothetical protein
MQLTRLLIKKTFCLARYLDVIKLSQIYYYCYYTSYAVHIYYYVYFFAERRDRNDNHSESEEREC